MAGEKWRKDEEAVKKRNGATDRAKKDLEKLAKDALKRHDEKIERHKK